MGKRKSRHGTVRISRDILVAIAEFLKTKDARKMGFYSRVDIVNSAVREFFIKYGPEPSPSSKIPTIGLMGRLAVPFWFIVERGAHASSEKYGFRLLTFEPTDFTSVDQIKVVRKWVTQGVSGIAWAVNDPEACTPIINEILAKEKIPIITFNGDAPESDRILFLDISHEEVVYLGIKLLAQRLEELKLASSSKPGKIVLIIGDLISGASRDMLRGAKRAYQEHPYLEEVRMLVDDGSPAKASKMIEEALNEFPELVGIHTAYDYEVPVAGEIITQRGLINKLTITGIALTGASVPYLQSGAVWGVIDNRPFDQGFMATQIIYRMLTEGVNTVAKEYIPDWPETKIYRPSPIVITHDTIHNFAKENPDKWKAISITSAREWNKVW